MPKRCPEEVRRKVRDLVAADRPISQIADDPDISDQTISNGRKQELIDIRAVVRPQPRRAGPAGRGQ